MEIREFALGVVTSEDLDAKLDHPPRGLTDDERSVPRVPHAPGRPPGLAIVHAHQARVPPLEGFHDPAQRRRILHAFANHELQATELFAWALLAFPHAPREFRRGLLAILADEQRHTRMYRDRLDELGGRFGEWPVSGYFWNKIASVSTPVEFICAMSLTFENANLDHSIDAADAARRTGDERTAALLDRVHVDEQRHVRFGWTWLERWKDADEAMWDAYRTHLHWPMAPGRARGPSFHRAAREAAGLDAGFIDQLAGEEPG